MAPDLSIIPQFEGERHTAYADPASGGEPYTIGIGTTVYPDGSPVRPGDTCTHDQAMAWLQDYVERRILPETCKLPGWEEMSPGQQAALIDAAYNLGVGVLFPPHTLGEALAERRWADVPAALRLYDDPGTSVEAGLRRRREAEIALWNQASPEPPIKVLLNGLAINGIPGRPPAFLDTGHAWVAVRPLATVLNLVVVVNAEANSVTLELPNLPPTDLPLKVLDGIGYISAASIENTLGLPVAYDAATRTLRIGKWEA